MDIVDVSKPTKPDCTTVMLQIIDAVKVELPLYEPDTFICGKEGFCVGCPKKLLELVDSELIYWEYQIERGQYRILKRFVDLEGCVLMFNADLFETTL